MWVVLGSFVEMLRLGLCAYQPQTLDVGRAVPSTVEKSLVVVVIGSQSVAMVEHYGPVSTEALN
jgi:hypothetical protein